MITTASQVSQVNGMANEGNRVLSAHIVMIGPMTTKKMMNAIARMTLVIVSPREGLGVIFMCILYSRPDDDVNRIAIVVNQTVAHIPQSAICIVENGIDDLTVTNDVPCFHSCSLAVCIKVCPFLGFVGLAVILVFIFD
jgi:hypothetical protein